MSFNYIPQEWKWKEINKNIIHRAIGRASGQIFKWDLRASGDFIEMRGFKINDLFKEESKTRNIHNRYTAIFIKEVFEESFCLVRRGRNIRTVAEKQSEQESPPSSISEWMDVTPLDNVFGGDPVLTIPSFKIVLTTKIDYDIIYKAIFNFDETSGRIISTEEFFVDGYPTDLHENYKFDENGNFINGI